MDPLADVLDVSRISGTVLAHVRAQAPWGLDLAPTAGASFHAVSAGTLWLELEARSSLQLMPGDVVLLPTGTRHALVSEPGTPTRAYDAVVKEQLMTDDGDLQISGLGATARFICAAFSYDHEVAHPLLSLLPEVVHVPVDEAIDGSAVQTTLRMLAGELGKRHVGARAAVDRLIDVSSSTSCAPGCRAPATREPRRGCVASAIRSSPPPSPSCTIARKPPGR